MKTLVLTIIIVFCSTLINAKEYFFCEEDLFGEGRSNTKNFILDYKSHEKDEIILAYKFSDYDVSILRFIQEEQVLFESFRESILNNTFDINDSDNDKNFLIDRRRYTIKIIKKTPIEWFGVTFLKENFKNFDTYRNSHEFKINLINGKAVLEYKFERWKMNCQVLKSNLLGESIESFEQHYFLDVGDGFIN